MTHLGIEPWRPRIEACVSADQVLLLVGAYLRSWTPQEINRLQVRLTAPIRSLDEVHQRAVELVHAELDFRGSNSDWALLRDLAMVITAAAARARFLDVHASDKPAVAPRDGAS